VTGEGGSGALPDALGAEAAVGAAPGGARPGKAKLRKRIKRWCYRVSTSPNFDLSNALAICINAIVLGLRW